MKLVFLVMDRNSNLDLVQEKPYDLVTDIVVDLEKMTWSEVDREWRKPVPIGQLRPDGRICANTVLGVFDYNKFNEIRDLVRGLKPG